MVRSAAAIILTLTAGIAIASAQAELVIHKEGTTWYHRPNCPVVRDATDVLLLARGQAEARGWKQHPECDPEKVRADDDPARAKAPSPPEFVQADDSKYYHREKCRNLHGGSKRVALEEAGKKLWPCPVCKPPVRRKSDGPAIPRR